VRTGDVLAAVFWLAVALVVTWSGYDLGLGTLVDPGPGFMIFWVGIVMAALAAAAFTAGVPQLLTTPHGQLRTATRWWFVPYVIGLLAIYAWLMPIVGFVTTTVVFLFILFATIDRQGWLMPPVGAVLATAVAYIVFHRWLGTQLPAGEAERWLTTNLPMIFGRS
jgi:putative tricarboxylic transport membrane protein